MDFPTSPASRPGPLARNLAVAAATLVGAGYLAMGLGGALFSRDPGIPIEFTATAVAWSLVAVGGGYVLLRTAIGLFQRGSFSGRSFRMGLILHLGWGFLVAALMYRGLIPFGSVGWVPFPGSETGISVPGSEITAVELAGAAILTCLPLVVWKIYELVVWGHAAGGFLSAALVVYFGMDFLGAIGRFVETPSGIMAGDVADVLHPAGMGLGWLALGFAAARVFRGAEWSLPFLVG